MSPTNFRCLLAAFVAELAIGSPLAVMAADNVDTLSAINVEAAPDNFESMWAGFDPRAEPLEIEVLKEWEEDDVVLRIVRFRIGVFKGQKATLAAVYGYPKDAARQGAKLPGLVQIHGGGQYADHKACLTNAKRGYATISIAWAGRISAPDYRVSPAEVRLFWDDKTDDVNYRLTTDWGLVDGYHAPGRNAGNQFPSAKPAAWTLDPVESPRNSGWFLCAMAGRRALTFLEQQPEVDPERLGVYGHSMGGKLTVMTSVDSRVKAAAPSCGGISDRDNDSELFRKTIGDDVSLRQVRCPIIFLSPANDFHGRIGDLPDAIEEIQSDDWRVTCSPHHNHQDTAEYEVATQLWFDQHLKNSFQFPTTPQTTLQLKTDDGVPEFIVRPDGAKPVVAVDVFYTQQGKANETPQDRLDTMHRFWHHAAATNDNGQWTAKLPLGHTDQPLWVYANVRYALDEPVIGAGYYYGIYSADSFNVSSLLTKVMPDELTKAAVKATQDPSLLIEDFEGDWQKEWFTYRPESWARSTNKLTAAQWQAPAGASLGFEVKAAERNTLVVRLDDYVAEVQVPGNNAWQSVVLRPGDFKDYGGDALPAWDVVRKLTLNSIETLRPGRGQTGTQRRVGATWNGTAPSFRNLRWLESYSFLDRRDQPTDPSNYEWTTDHMHVGVRWQPFIGRPDNNAFDANRPVIATDSSYVQFWVSWSAMEPTIAHQDYVNHPSQGLRAIEAAVDVCRKRGLKVEFVFFHCPSWATESGEAGGYKPKDGLFEGYVERIATHFKGRTHAYQLYHESNLQGMMQGADVNFIIEDILLAGAEKVREVYAAEPAEPVIVSTTGMSPCPGCQTTQGLDGLGGTAINQFYDLMIDNGRLMDAVDALNLNIADSGSGYGRVDDLIPSVWDQYELVRSKLDAAGYNEKAVLASESWIVWDDANNARDINDDGVKNERDAFAKAITIFGHCLERGLNTVNLPWSDNSSGWAMGLTKRRDYNGRVRTLNPDIVIAANDGGPEIVTRKLSLRGPDESFQVADGSGHVFTVDNYINPPDPNHLHYYIWRWYAQIAGGVEEVVRHALANQTGNDIVVNGEAFAGDERYRMSSWNRSRERFTVLVYAENADGSSSATVTIPATIQSNQRPGDGRKRGFVGEGFQDGETYVAHVITKDISDRDGSDVEPVDTVSPASAVTDNLLTVAIPNMKRFTAIEFVRASTLLK